MQRLGIAVLVAASAALLHPSQARSQAWIGLMVGEMMARDAAYQQEMACMGGAAMPDSEVREASDQAPALLGGYWTAVSAGTSPIASFKLDRKTRWSYAGQSADQAQLATIRDPFASGETTFSEIPIGFVRAGDGSSALGQWVVRDGQDHVIGTYQALLRRRGGTWLISTLELTGRFEWIDPVVQYCHLPGDVLPHRVKHAAAILQGATEQEARAVRRYDEAAAQDMAAQQAAAASPTIARRAETARRARQRAEQREADLVARRRELMVARTQNAQALADQAVYEAQRAAGIATLQAARSE